MKKLLFIMAVSALAGVAKADYTTYTYDVAVKELNSSVTSANLDVYDASTGGLISITKTEQSLVDGREGKGMAMTFTSDITPPSEVYCVITTTSNNGTESWKSSALEYGSAFYDHDMYFSTMIRMSWTFGSNPKSYGWTEANVPEPTSGLLMLLGMAGLALRRRRA